VLIISDFFLVMEVSLTLTKFINISNVWPIQEYVSTFLNLWEKYFTGPFVNSYFAPSGIRVCSVDDSVLAAEGPHRVWELHHSVGDDSPNTYKTKWWKIIIELKSLRQDETKFTTRPSLNCKGGCKTVNSPLHGYTITMTLYSINPASVRPKDALASERNLKKFFNYTYYQLIMQIITYCELPKKNHFGKSFEEMYQINAKVELFSFLLLATPFT